MQALASCCRRCQRAKCTGKAEVCQRSGRAHPLRNSAQRPPRRSPQALVGCRRPLFEPRHKPRQPAVAHRDRHVAPQPIESRPAHRRPVELALEGLLVQRAQPIQRRIHEFRARLELGISNNRRFAAANSTGTHPGRCRSQKPAAPCPASAPPSIGPLCSIVRYEMQRLASIW